MDRGGTLSCDGHTTVAPFVLLLAVTAFIALAHPVPALAGCALVLIGLPLHRVLLSRGAIP